MKELAKDLSKGLAIGVIAVLAIIAFSKAAFSAPFVTPGMMKRNGLTDEQYEMLWKAGKNPKVDIATMRDLIFRSGRYQNVTNWLDECGRTNNFAKLSYKLQDENFVLTDKNKVLVSSNSVLRVEVEQLEPDAKELRKAVKAAEKAAKKDTKNFEKWIKDTEKARDKSSEDMAEFYDSILEIATGSVPNDKTGVRDTDMTEE